MDPEKDLEKPKKPRRNRAERRKLAVNKQKKLEKYLSHAWGRWAKEHPEDVLERARKSRDHYSEGGRSHGEYGDWDSTHGDPTYRWVAEEDKHNVLDEVKKLVNTFGADSLGEEPALQCEICFSEEDVFTYYDRIMCINCIAQEQLESELG
jgi:hypothetical protein